MSWPRAIWRGRQRRSWSHCLTRAATLIRPGSLQRQVERGGDILGLHRRAQLPGDDIAREVVEHARQIEPAPADDLQVGEVGLPELVWRRGLVLELVGRLHDDVGGAGDQI